MTLEIFGLLKSDGDQAQSDHLFIGKAADIESIANVLDEIFATNKRMRSVSAMAARFREGSKLIMPMVRLNKKDCRTLVDSLDGYAASMPKTTRARKLRDLMITALSVY